MIAGYPRPSSGRACAAAYRGGADTPALVLAAGASRRFGRTKALARWRGRLLLEHAIDQARTLNADVRVITGCRAPLLPLRSHTRPTSWLYAKDWSEGLAASLRAGVGALPADARGVFVVLVDQPLVDRDSLEKLREAAESDPMKPQAADYNGRPGVPAYLPRWLWPAVMELDGDRGAGQLLAAAGANRLAIAGVRADVDTPRDLAAIR